MARQLGYSEQVLEALGREEDPPVLEPAARAAIRYARIMARDAHQVTADVFADMKRHYSDRQILELTCVVGLASYWNRFTTALRVDLSGTDEPYDPDEPGL